MNSHTVSTRLGEIGASGTAIIGLKTVLSARKPSVPDEFANISKSHNISISAAPSDVDQTKIASNVASGSTELEIKRDNLNHNHDHGEQHVYHIHPINHGYMYHPNDIMMDPIPLQSQVEKGIILANSTTGTPNTGAPVTFAHKYPNDSSVSMNGKGNGNGIGNGRTWIQSGKSIVTIVPNNEIGIYIWC